MSARNWFDVDKDGLAKLLADRSPAFVLFELFSNCTDTDAKRIRIDFMPCDGRPQSLVRVEDDDPNGFADLAHASNGSRPQMISKTAYSEIHNVIDANGFGGVGETDLFRFKCYANRNLHLQFKRLDLLAKFNAIAGGRRLRPADAAE